MRAGPDACASVRETPAPKNRHAWQLHAVNGSKATTAGCRLRDASGPRCLRLTTALKCLDSSESWALPIHTAGGARLRGAGINGRLHIGYRSPRYRQRPHSHGKTHKPPVDCDTEVDAPRDGHLLREAGRSGRFRRGLGSRTSGCPIPSTPRKPPASSRFTTR
jgi:hypothetical protein